jgi:hypothetical protein
MLKHLLIITALLSISTYASAQTFGFGFVRGYGGLVYQSYNASGLNQFITKFNIDIYETIGVLKSFDDATGYRIGIIFFRATSKNNIILTAKGNYQSLEKTNTAKIENENSYNYSLYLDLNNWSLGIDVGWEITKIISWKILDASVNFNYVTLTETTDLSGETIVQEYKSNSGVFGYSIGTGIIVAILKDYISVEGLVGYTYLSIDNVYNENGVPFLNQITTTSNSYSSFIDAGGFTAVIQLNLGFPLL